MAPIPKELEKELLEEDIKFDVDAVITLVKTMYTLAVELEQIAKQQLKDKKKQKLLAQAQQHLNLADQLLKSIGINVDVDNFTTEEFNYLEKNINEQFVVISNEIDRMNEQIRKKQYEKIINGWLTLSLPFNKKILNFLGINIGKNPANVLKSDLTEINRDLEKHKNTLENAQAILKKRRDEKETSENNIQREIESFWAIPNIKEEFLEENFGIFINHLLMNEESIPIYKEKFEAALQSVLGDKYEKLKKIFEQEVASLNQKYEISLNDEQRDQKVIIESLFEESKLQKIRKALLTKHKDAIGFYQLHGFDNQVFVLQKNLSEFDQVASQFSPIFVEQNIESPTIIEVDENYMDNFQAKWREITNKESFNKRKNKLLEQFEKMESLCESTTKLVTNKSILAKCHACKSYLIKSKFPRFVTSSGVKVIDGLLTPVQDVSEYDLLEEHRLTDVGFSSKAFIKTLNLSKLLHEGSRYSLKVLEKLLPNSCRKSELQLQHKVDMLDVTVPDITKESTFSFESFMKQFDNISNEIRGFVVNEVPSYFFRAIVGKEENGRFDEPGKFPEYANLWLKGRLQRKDEFNQNFKDQVIEQIHQDYILDKNLKICEFMRSLFAQIKELYEKGNPDVSAEMLGNFKILNDQIELLLQDFHKFMEYKQELSRDPSNENIRDQVIKKSDMIEEKLAYLAAESVKTFESMENIAEYKSQEMITLSIMVDAVYQEFANEAITQELISPQLIDDILREIGIDPKNINDNIEYVKLFFTKERLSENIVPLMNKNLVNMMQQFEMYSKAPSVTRSESKKLSLDIDEFMKMKWDFTGEMEADKNVETLKKLKQLNIPKKVKVYFIKQYFLCQDFSPTDDLEKEGRIKKDVKEMKEVLLELGETFEDYLTTPNSIKRYFPEKNSQLSTCLSFMHDSILGNQVKLDIESSLEIVKALYAISSDLNSQNKPLAEQIFNFAAKMLTSLGIDEHTSVSEESIEQDMENFKSATNGNPTKNDLNNFITHMFQQDDSIPIDPEVYKKVAKKVFETEQLTVILNLIDEISKTFNSGNIINPEEKENLMRDLFDKNKFNKIKSALIKKHKDKQQCYYELDYSKDKLFFLGKNIDKYKQFAKEMHYRLDDRKYKFSQSIPIAEKGRIKSKLEELSRQAAFNKRKDQLNDVQNQLHNFLENNIGAIPKENTSTLAKYSACLSLLALTHNSRFISGSVINRVRAIVEPLIRETRITLFGQKSKSEELPIFKNVIDKLVNLLDINKPINKSLMFLRRQLQKAPEDKLNFGINYSKLDATSKNVPGKKQPLIEKCQLITDSFLSTKDESSDPFDTLFKQFNNDFNMSFNVVVCNLFQSVSQQLLSFSDDDLQGISIETIIQIKILQDRITNVLDNFEKFSNIIDPIEKNSKAVLLAKELNNVSSSALSLLHNLSDDPKNVSNKMIIMCSFLRKDLSELFSALQVVKFSDPSTLNELCLKNDLTKKLAYYFTFMTSTKEISRILVNKFLNNTLSNYQHLPEVKVDKPEISSKFKYLPEFLAKFLDKFLDKFAAKRNRVKLHSIKTISTKDINDLESFKNFLLELIKQKQVSGKSKDKLIKNCLRNLEYNIDDMVKECNDETLIENKCQELLKIIDRLITNTKDKKVIKNKLSQITKSIKKKIALKHQGKAIAPPDKPFPKPKPPGIQPPELLLDEQQLPKPPEEPPPELLLDEQQLPKPPPELSDEPQPPPEPPPSKKFSPEPRIKASPFVAIRSSLQQFKPQVTPKSPTKKSHRHKKKRDY